MMPTLQDQYDDAMYDFSRGDCPAAIAKLKAILAADPTHFDAQLSLGMVHCRQGDLAAALQEGLKAEKMRPDEQLVHTNLSMFYLKSGNKKAAEHHALRARVASWIKPEEPPSNPDLQMAQPPPPPNIKAG